MNKLSRMTPSIALCVLFMASSGARATCTQADLTGTWYTSGVAAGAYNATHDDASFTTFCKLVIGSTGAFTAASSKCNSSLGVATVAGTAKVAATCQVTAFTMKVTLGGTTYNYTVDYMVLNKNKTSFTGTGNKSVSSGGYQFMWVGTKS